MNVTMTAMSAHIINDRMDRSLFIAQHIGWGEPRIKHYNEERNNIEIITSTGVLLIKNVDETMLITAFVPGIDMVTSICRKCGYTRVPNNLYSAVIKSQKKIRSWK